MADFTGKEIRNTYQRLLQLDQFIVQNGTGSINLEKVNLDGDLTITGSQVITEDLHVHGNITAQQFISTTVSSSVIYQSGSTQFGDTIDDTHSFTGSLNIGGSVVVKETVEAKQGAFGAFFANPQIIDENITLPANYNSRLYGPITVAAGKTLTVGSNAKLDIIDI